MKEILTNESRFSIQDKNERSKKSIQYRIIV